MAVHRASSTIPSESMLSASRLHPTAVIGAYLAIQERWGIPVRFVANHRR